MSSSSFPRWHDPARSGAASSGACLPPETLEQLLAGTLQEPELGILRAHLASCERCQTALNDLTEVVELRPWGENRNWRPAHIPSPDEVARVLQRLRQQTDRVSRPPETLQYPLAGPTGGPAPTDLLQRLPQFGSYEVMAELGRGGMGIVLKAFDPELQRLVALKVLRPDRLDEVARARFVREARAAAAIEHDHVVPVYAVVNPENQPPYLVMPYIAGHTLRQRIDAAQGLPPQEAAEIIAQAADGLTAAHRAGLVHRDVKPSNILCDPATGRARVMDFGLVHLLDQPGDVTQDGFVVGTPEYMSPEQVCAPQRIDVRTDVYGLGATLYEALTGTPPFAGTTRMVIYQILQGELFAPRRLKAWIPRDLETICLKALAREPERRYQSAADLRDDLRRWLRGEPIQARPAGPREKVWRWCRRNPLLAGLTVLVATLLSVLAAGASIAAVQQRHLTTIAEEARREEQKARRQAEDVLDRQYVANATRLLKEGDPFGALPWIVESLQLTAPDSERATMHRARLAAALQYGPRIVRLFPHADGVVRAEFSPDGKYVVTASKDGTAQIWETATGRATTPPLRHEAALQGAFFSRDGQIVVTYSADTTARIWSAATGQPLTQPMVHSGGWVLAAALSPDGRQLVTACGDRVARVWDTLTGTLVRTTLRHPGSVRFVQFSPNGKQILTTGEDGEARFWDAQTGNLARKPLEHDSGVRHASFRFDGRRLVTASQNAAAYLWDLDRERPVGSRPLRHVNSLVQVAFSPDGQRFLTSSLDATAQLRDAETGKLLAIFRHEGPVLAVAFSTDGRLLATAGADGTARVRDATTGRMLTPLLRHAGSVVSVAFHPANTHLLTASADGTARLWQLDVPEPSLPPLRHAALVRWADVSAGGRYVVTAGYDSKAQIWNATTGEPLGSPLAHRREVVFVAFSRDGQQVVTTSMDGTAQIWKVGTSEPITPPLGHARTVHRAAFSPDGRFLVTASADWTARIWDIATAKPIGEPLRHRGEVHTALFTQDGRRVVTAAADGTVRFWDATTGQPAYPKLPSLSGITSLALSPDGRYLATGSLDGRVWNIDTGEPITPPLPHHAGITYLTFSPDCRFVVTTSADHTACIWEAHTGRLATPPLQHEGHVVHASYSPDGHRLITASSTDCAVRVWDATTGELLGPILRHRDTVWYAAFTPDGQRFLSTCGDQAARFWNVPQNDQPLDELLLLARILSGRRSQTPGTLVPLEAPRFRQDLKELQQKNPFWWGHGGPTNKPDQSAGSEITRQS